MNPNDPKRAPSDDFSSVTNLRAVAPPTLTDSLTDLPRPPQFDPADGALRLDDDFLGRYQTRAQIGEGGMGEVRLTLDGRIGREVAMKVAREGEEGSRRDREERFLREARIQGQLEHPSIVPVYDLGRDPAGAQYFTMKRVRGLTVEEIVARLADDEPEARERFSRRKLLTAFGSVCLAVDFAHARGVLHRDLKPANIMLGDFGEVYVLDWGLAKVIGAGAESPPVPSIEAVAKPSVVGRTVAGAMLGTPGYMAPEQVRGDIDELDGRTDVYSLGAILFELLTLMPLHLRSTVTEVIASTVDGADARCSVRAPDREVPPELEAICLRATRLDPAERFPSARELNDAIERFLDGDRDQSLRHEMADKHAAMAQQAADAALSSELDDERGRALHEVGRALALDPGHGGAKRTLRRLLTEPPAELPASAQAEAETFARREQRAAARTGAMLYLSWFLFVPLVAWMGVLSWPAVGLSGALYLASVILCLAIARQPDPARPLVWALLLVSSLAVSSSGLVLGPYVIMPSLVAVNAMSFMMARNKVRRPLVLAIAACTLLLPIALAWAGVLPQHYRFHDGALTILPTFIALPPLATTVFLVLVNLAIIVKACVFIARTRDALSATEQRLQLHLWQLRQLVPDEANAPVPSETELCKLPPDSARA